MALNPEFRKNIWQEITVHRLIGAPLFIGAVLLFIYLVSNNDARALNAASLFLFIIFTAVWGSRMAYTSVASEVQGLTWDNQRTSSLDPWTLAWGKLLGSNALTWYASFFALMAYLLTINTPAFGSPYALILLAVLGGLLAQSLAMLSSLGMVLRHDAPARQSVGLIGAILLAFMLVLSMLPFRGAHNNAIMRIDWYFMTFDMMEFLIYTAAVCLAWTVYGIYVIMRMELQMMTTFLPWLAFVAFAIFYMAGFSSSLSPKGATEFQTAAALAFFISLGLNFIILFIQKKDPVGLRAISRAIGTRRWLALGYLLPNWAATIPVTALFAVLAEAAFDANGKFVFLTAFFLFMRDAGVILFLHLGKNVRLSDITIVIYLAFIYGIIPGILYAAHLDDYAFLFYPGISVYGLAAAATQTIMVLILLKWQWTRNHGTLSGPIQQDA